MFGMGTGGSSLPSSPLWLYQRIPALIYFFSLSFSLPSNLLFSKIHNYIAIYYETQNLSKLVKIIDFHQKDFRKKLSSQFLEIKPSTY